MGEWLKAEVRVAALEEKDREFAGTENLLRAPSVGDVGTVVYEYPGPDGKLSVQCKDGTATLWLADFAPSELERLPED